MTARQLYEAILVELNKVNAPSILLEDFNHFLNKAAHQYINKVYNVYDVNKQTTDDIHVLTSTAVLKAGKDKLVGSKLYGGGKTGAGAAVTGTFAGTYRLELPQDYYHLLNCICEMVPKKNFKCYNAGYPVSFSARRLVGDMFSQILNNAYLRPTYKRPYYYIHNVNRYNEVNLPIGTVDEIGKSVVTPDSNSANVPYTGGPGKIVLNGANKEGVEDNTWTGNKDQFPSTIIGSNKLDNVERIAGVRYGNQSRNYIEIRIGTDASLFELDNVYLDYIKTPQLIRLTQDQIDLTEDTSQMLEWSDNSCYEILNIAVALVMENSMDPRLQTNIPINQTIARPTGEVFQSR